MSSLPNSIALPRVAVVGRPNVGKSTLFNRLVGARRAITDPTPGVTRDPVEGECRIAGRRVRLIDTGGYRLDTDGIDTLVSGRSLEVIEQADVGLLMLDVSEVQPEDEDLIALVRAKASRSILVVNKVDNDRRDLDAWNLHTYGFRRVVHVSAEHRRNFAELVRHIAEELAAAPVTGRSVTSEDPGIRLALLGKPNTGKSTLLNALLDEQRAIVSPIPGTTRDVIEGRFLYAGRTISILDTAGIRRKRAVTQTVEYYSVNRAIGSIERADVVLLVVDSTEGITEQDKKIVTQVIKRGKGIVLVFNKWDLMEETPNAFNAVCDRAHFVFPVLSYAPIIAVSAIHKTGLKRVLDTCLRIRRQLDTTIATGPLNRAVRGWTEQHPVPHGGGPRYAVRYITQISSNPVRFLLFVNRSKGFPESWLSYLRNKMRREFGIPDIPFAVELRES